MKYRNYHPSDSDPVGRLLQNRLDYDYLKHVAPDKVPDNIKAMWRLIDIIGFILLCMFVAKYN